jgi:hypothetical protein
VIFCYSRVSLIPKEGAPLRLGRVIDPRIKTLHQTPLAVNFFSGFYFRTLWKSYFSAGQVLA